MSEKLWAPWRLQYILDPKAGPLKAGKKRACVFCNKRRKRSDAQADREDLILAHGKSCFTILNKFPYNNGHLMVMPYEHIGNFGEIKKETLHEMMEGLQRAVKILEKTFHADGFNLGMNLGRAAGAGIPDHVHMHVVPRWSGDTNFMPVLGDVRVLPEYIETTYDRLVGEFRK